MADGRPVGKSSRLTLTGALVAACVLAAFVLRVHFSSDRVFADDGVRFQGNDAWYHARLIDNLIANFPRPLGFDPFARFPGGASVTTPPFFDLVIASVALALGGGAPSQRLVETVAAYLPAILGSLTIVPVYLLGRQLFGRASGLLAATALAVLPGQFLARSSLGSTDHHVAETLLTTLAMLFLIEALTRGDRWRWALLAGVCLALYFLTWSGASLFVAIVVAWALAQVLIDHVAGRATIGIAVLCLAALGPPLAAVVLFRNVLPGSTISMIALAGGLIVILGLAAASHLLAQTRVSRWWIVVVAAIAPLASLLAAQMIAPGVMADVLDQLGRMRGSSMTANVSEGVALLFPGGRFDPLIAWQQFAHGIFLAPFAFAAVAYRAWREPQRERLLFLMWTVVVVAGTLGQNRFGYYSAINVCLLTGAAAARLIDWGGLAGAIGRERAWYRGMAGAAVTILVLVPALRVSVPTMKTDQGPSPQALAAADWLRANTPEPFPDDSEYLRHYGRHDSGDFRYPATSYGILNWWDHGYLILRRGRRLPSSNPTQLGARETASVFLEQNEETAHEQLRALGSRYVMIDRLQVYLPSPRGELVGWFRAMASYAGRTESEFRTKYLYRQEDGTLVRLVLLRPEYYRTLVARLYLFRGEAFEPRDSTWVVASRPARDGREEDIRMIDELHRFDSWPAAAAFLAEHSGEEYEVVGRDPTRSCVPLEALEGFRQVYPTPEEDQGPPLSAPLRIFEVLAPERAGDGPTAGSAAAPAAAPAWPSVPR